MTERHWFAAAAERDLQVTPFEYTEPAKIAVPELSRVRSEVVVPVLEVEATAKIYLLTEVEATPMESVANGEVVPTPILPFLFTTKSVVSEAPPADVEETAKRVLKLVVEVACTESRAYGVVVPTPSLPFTLAFAS